MNPLDIPAAGCPKRKAHPMVPKVDSRLVQPASELLNERLTIEQARRYPVAKMARVLNETREPDDPVYTARDVGKIVREDGVPVHRGQFDLIEWGAAMMRRMGEQPTAGKAR